MRKLLLLFLLTVPAFGQFAQWQKTVVTSLGRPANQATVKVCASSDSVSCTSAITVYSSSSGAALANPFQTDTVGNYSFYAATGCYTVKETYLGATYIYQACLGDSSHAVRYADQFPGATTPLKITAACADLAGANGIVFVASSMASGAIPSLPSGCIVEDARGNTGNGGILWSRELSGTEQYGFSFATQNLASDGQSSTAVIGQVASGINGTNVVGVRGEVSSAASAAVFGVNHGDHGNGGVSVQGDSPNNILGSIGVEGTAGSGATSLSPSIGIKGLSTGSAVTNTTIAGVFANDNGLPVLATITAAHDSATAPVAVKAVSGLDTSTEIEVANTTAGGKSWRLHTSGVSDPVTGSPGSLILYDQTDNTVPFSIAPDAATVALQLVSGGIATPGIAVGGGTNITKIVVYSQSLTPASIAANTTAEDTFTVTGLTTADIIIAINGPLATAGTFIGGERVSGANQLKILFGNNTSGSLTPAAGTYQIVALRH